MAERVLLLTGSLAEPRLKRVVAELAAPEIEPVVVNLGVKVAALMTSELIRRRLPSTAGADRVVLPGRFRGDVAALGQHYGVPFERGPEELADLPGYFGREGRPPALDRYETRLFAEIIEAPELSVDAIVERARSFRDQGADVIDLGCLPERPFPHLEEAIRALKAAGLEVSVDSADTDELARGARAGAAYLLSVTADTLWLVDEGPAVPVVIPATPGDMASLDAAIAALQARGRRFIADPVLEPIHFGFADSVVRYHELRRRHPDIEILMGIGNVTELTDADTTGLNALLMGICSELRIGHVLAVQVSPHCRRALKEFDAARRQFLAAREAGALPQGFGPALMGLRDRQPFASTPAEIAALAAEVRDANWRIEVAADGIHLYNRDGHHVGATAAALFPHLKVGQDAAHAFYLGTELMKAEIAFALGKRYAQDEPLGWGVAVDAAAKDDSRFVEAGPTLAHRP